MRAIATLIALAALSVESRRFDFEELNSHGDPDEQDVSATPDDAEESGFQEALRISKARAEEEEASGFLGFQEDSDDEPLDKDDVVSVDFGPIESSVDEETEQEQEPQYYNNNDTDDRADKLADYLADQAAELNKVTARLEKDGNGSPNGWGRLEDLGDGLTLRVLKKGDGVTFPKRYDRLLMHYTGSLASGEVFDSSRTRGEPFEFTIGVGEVIAGWDVGVARLSLGERGVLHVPPTMAYGERGAGDLIPPNSDLTFDVELLGINVHASDDEPVEPIEPVDEDNAAPKEPKPIDQELDFDAEDQAQDEADAGGIEAEALDGDNEGDIAPHRVGMDDLEYPDYDDVDNEGADKDCVMCTQEIKECMASCNRCIKTPQTCDTCATAVCKDEGGEADAGGIEAEALDRDNEDDIAPKHPGLADLEYPDYDDLDQEETEKEDQAVESEAEDEHIGEEAFREDEDTVPDSPEQGDTSKNAMEDPSIFRLAAPGQSCADYCGQLNFAEEEGDEVVAGICRNNSWPQSKADLEAILVATGEECKTIYRKQAHMTGPSIHVKEGGHKGYCYWRGHSDCSLAHEDYRNFCPCCGSQEGPCGVPQNSPESLSSKASMKHPLAARNTKKTLLAVVALVTVVCAGVLYYVNSAPPPTEYVADAN